MPAAIKTVALLGTPSDRENVCQTLLQQGLTVSGYEPTLNHASLNRADIVVLDQIEREAQDTGVWRRLEGLCRLKPILLFSDDRHTRDEVLRWGAYYAGEAVRRPQDIALLVARAGALKPKGEPTPARRLLIGASAPSQALWRAVQRLATSPHASILLRGEPGSGKRTFARALHMQSACDGEFHEPQDPRQVEELLAASAPGTVYFGDLARLSNSMQARLHRLLKARRPESRFLAGLCTSDGEGGRRATIHGTLQQAFGIVLEVPPLRSRPEDMAVLTRALLSRAAESRGLRVQALEVSTLELLKQQAWPGNVRQLERMLQRALLLSGGNAIDEVLLSLLPNRSRTGFQLPEDGVDLEALERDALAQALERARGNRTRAASLLRLTRDQVRYRLAKLEPPEPGREQSA